MTPHERHMIRMLELAEKPAEDWSSLVLSCVMVAVLLAFAGVILL